MVILQREFVKNSISAKISTYSPVKLLADIMKNISHCGPTKNCFPHLHMKKCEIRRLLILQFFYWMLGGAIKMRDWGINYGF